MCLSNNSPIMKRTSIPGRPFSLYSGAISPSIQSQSILPASKTSSCFRLMIWSSRARNRSFDSVVLCFFGRIVPSDADKESCFPLRGNPINEIARFGGLKLPIPAISNASRSEKQTLPQSLRALFTDDKLVSNDPFHHGVVRRCEIASANNGRRTFIDFQNAGVKALQEATQPLK